MSPSSLISIIIADDHEIFRRGFKSIIERQKNTNILFIEEACNGLELVEKVKIHQPNIVITDIKMPIMDGLQACRIIRKDCLATKVIALSLYDESNFILDMVDAGASGYLTKNADQEEILIAIKTVSEGFTYFSKTTRDKIAVVSLGNQLNQKKIRNHEFSLQEIKIMKLLCKQMSTKEIAQHLELSTRTIEDYRSKISEKIGARNAVGIALYAILNDIILQSEL